MKLQSARDEFFKLVNDLQHPSQSKKTDGGNSLSVKSPLTEYYSQSNNWLIPKLTALNYQFNLSDFAFHSSGINVTPEQPPEV
jgi:hypothetical protein